MAGIESIEHLRRELKREQHRTASLNFDALSGSVGDDAGAAPLFLRKTFKMIDACPPQLGGWSAAGDTFLVCDPDAFSGTAIPQYFRHSNFSSFVRQLNFYGFRKVKTDKHGLQRKGKAGAMNKVWEFRHPLFKRGQPALLNEMRKKGDYVDSVEVSALRGEIITLRNRCDSMTTTIDRLCGTVEALMGKIESYEGRAMLPEDACNESHHAPMSIATETSEPAIEPPRKRQARPCDVTRRPTVHARAPAPTAQPEIRHTPPGHMLDTRPGVAAVMEMLEKAGGQKAPGTYAADGSMVQRRFSLSNSEDGGFALFRFPSNGFGNTEFDPVALGIVDASELEHRSGKDEDFQFFEEVSTLLGDPHAIAG